MTLTMALHKKRMKKTLNILHRSSATALKHIIALA